MLPEFVSELSPGDNSRRKQAAGHSLFPHVCVCVEFPVIKRVLLSEL